MKTIVRLPHEKILAAASFLALASSIAWAWTDRANPPVLTRTKLRPVPTAPEAPGAGFPESATPAPWIEPMDQSAGPGWRFELFTPPGIHRRVPDGGFAVDGPPNLPAAEAAVDDFGLELEAVRPEPYRLQLVGYFGVPGDYTGMFTSPRMSETLLGRAGRRFAPLRLRIEDIVVTRSEPGENSAGTAVSIGARAVVADEESGKKLTLDSREPCYTGSLVATLWSRAGGGPQELHAGEEWKCGRATYRVARLQLEPAEATVTRVLPDTPHPETRALHPTPNPRERAGRRRPPEEMAVAAQEPAVANPPER